MNGRQRPQRHPRLHLRLPSRHLRHVHGPPILARPRHSTTEGSLPHPSRQRGPPAAFLILSYLELKIVGNLKRDQGLILAYAISSALCCLTIIMQANKRGSDGASWYR